MRARQPHRGSSGRRTTNSHHLLDARTRGCVLPGPRLPAGRTYWPTQSYTCMHGKQIAYNGSIVTHIYVRRGGSLSTPIATAAPTRHVAGCVVRPSSAPSCASTTAVLTSGIWQPSVDGVGIVAPPWMKASRVWSDPMPRSAELSGRRPRPARRSSCAVLWAEDAPVEGSIALEPSAGLRKGYSTSKTFYVRCGTGKWV